VEYRVIDMRAFDFENQLLHPSQSSRPTPLHIYCQIRDLAEVAMEGSNETLEVVLEGQLGELRVGLHHSARLASNVNTHSCFAKHANEVVDDCKPIFCPEKVVSM
jgi:hypothetical protein